MAFRTILLSFTHPVAFNIILIKILQLYLFRGISYLSYLHAGLRLARNEAHHPFLGCGIQLISVFSPCSLLPPLQRKGFKSLHATIRVLIISLDTPRNYVSIYKKHQTGVPYNTLYNISLAPPTPTTPYTQTALFVFLHIYRHRVLFYIHSWYKQYCVCHRDHVSSGQRNPTPATATAIQNEACPWHQNSTTNPSKHERNYCYIHRAELHSLLAPFANL